MTTLTPNYNLVLYNSTTDASNTFLAWRTAIDGISTGSNFYLIDTALANIQTQVNSLRTMPYITGVLSGSTYIATISGSFSSYITNINIILSVDTTNAGAVSLNINSLGNKNLMKIDNSGAIVAMSGKEIKINKNYLFRYDGTQWIWVNAVSADQLNINGTSGNIVTVNTDNTFLGTTTPAALIAANAMPYILNATCIAFSPVDATTYYVGSIYSLVPSSTVSLARVYVPRNGTISRVDINFRNSGTLGTTETSTIYLSYNNSTNTTLSTGVNNSSVNQYINTPGLSVAVTAGGFFEIKWVTPTWVTNPTNVIIHAQIYIN